MILIGQRRRSQAPPPHILFEAIAEPGRRTRERLWLLLLDDEVPPQIIESHPHHRVVWSSIFTKRPDAQIVFELEPNGSGTDLTMSILVDPPEPDGGLVGHMRKRIMELINRDLRHYFGQ